MEEKKEGEGGEKKTNGKIKKREQTTYLRGVVAREEQDPDGNAAESHGAEPLLEMPRVLERARKVRYACGVYEYWQWSGE